MTESLAERLSAATSVAVHESSVDRAIAESIGDIPEAVPQITNAGEYEQAAEFLRRIKRAQKDLDERRKLITRPLSKAVDAVNALFTPPKLRLNQLANQIADRMMGYRIEADRRAREAERAAKKAEAQRQAEANARREREERLREQVEKTAARRGETPPPMAPTPAELAPPPPPEPPAVRAPVVPKVEGVHTRTVWTADVTDMVAFCRAIADGVPGARPDMLKPVARELNKYASALKDQASIPGLTVTRDEKTVARAK
jgi:hypothetical protein